MGYVIKETRNGKFKGFSGVFRTFEEACRSVKREKLIDSSMDFEIFETSKPDLILWSSLDNINLLRFENYSVEEWTYLEELNMCKSDKGSVYFDIDGTLGKWYSDRRGFTYEEILDPSNHYFRRIEPHPFAIDLAKHLHEKGFDVCVISSADRNTIRDKWEWLNDHLPFIPKENIFFCPLGADKTRFIKGNAEKSVLIDDYKKNLSDWRNYGGLGMKYLNGVNSPSIESDIATDIHGHLIEKRAKASRALCEEYKAWEKQINETILIITRYLSKHDKELNKNKEIERD